VLLTVRVAVAGEEPVRFGDDGEIVQVKLMLEVEQARSTVPLNPPKGARLIVEVPDCPGAETLMLGGLADKLKSVTLTVTAAEVEGP
jgi:hypothetical protein